MIMQLYFIPFLFYLGLEDMDQFAFYKNWREEQDENGFTILWQNLTT